MLITEKIDVMPIADVKHDFYNLMNMIVLEYGDNQEETYERNELTASRSSTSSGAESLSTILRVAPHALTEKINEKKYALKDFNTLFIPLPK